MGRQRFLRMVSVAGDSPARRMHTLWAEPGKGMPSLLLCQAGTPLVWREDSIGFSCVTCPPGSQGEAEHLVGQPPPPPHQGVPPKREWVLPAEEGDPDTRQAETAGVHGTPPLGSDLDQNLALLASGLALLPASHSLSSLPPYHRHLCTLEMGKLSLGWQETQGLLSCCTLGVCCFF